MTDRFDLFFLLSSFSFLWRHTHTTTHKHRCRVFERGRASGLAMQRCLFSFSFGESERTHTLTHNTHHAADTRCPAPSCFPSPRALRLCCVCCAWAGARGAGSGGLCAGWKSLIVCCCKKQITFVFGQGPFVPLTHPPTHNPPWAPPPWQTSPNTRVRRRAACTRHPRLLPTRARLRSRRPARPPPSTASARAPASRA